MHFFEIVLDFWAHRERLISLPQLVLVVSLCDYAWWPASPEYVVPNCTVLSGPLSPFGFPVLLLSSLPTGHVLFFSRLNEQFSQGAKLMEWTTPQHEEIDLNCEVSSYANAEL